MSHILNKQMVLSLNSAWQAIDQMTVGEAITAMTGGGTFDRQGRFIPPSSPPALALNLENGVLLGPPVKWDEWIKLPVREGDHAIHASHNRVIRAPTVVIRPNYQKMPMKSRKFSFNAIWERDKGTCQYTGRKLTREEANLDHIIPDSRGGRKTFENIALSDKVVNTKKGARTPEEAGLKLLRKPERPKPVPASVILSKQAPAHPDHVPFL